MNKHLEGWVKKRPQMPYLQTLLKFRWEWRLEWEENNKGNLKGPDWWTQKHMVFKTREQMRQWKRYVLHADWCRNVVLKRRLVQVNWEPYNDSFSYNAKGNGNGH